MNGRFDQNLKGFVADVQPKLFIVQPSDQIQYLPVGQYLPCEDIQNLSVPTVQGWPIIGGFAGPRVQSVDGGFFVESRLPIVSLSGFPLQLLYRAGDVRIGAVPLYYQLEVTGSPQSFGWDYCGPWQIVVATAVGVIQSIRLFNGPIDGLNLILGNAGEIATISGVARF